MRPAIKIIASNNPSVNVVAGRMFELYLFGAIFTAVVIVLF